MTMQTLIRIAKRLLVVLLFGWLIDWSIVQQLPAEYFQTGKSGEVILLLALAWRYCMPTISIKQPEWNREE